MNKTTEYIDAMPIAASEKAALPKTDIRAVHQALDAEHRTWAREDDSPQGSVKARLEQAWPDSLADGQLIKDDEGRDQLKAMPEAKRSSMFPDPWRTNPVGRFWDRLRGRDVTPRYLARLTKEEQEIEQLKQERKRRSAALQRKLFEQFRILNARGEVKDLCELFAPTYQGAPPAGAGECAAPKLLQYAYQHQLEPIAMAEFWWGDSPKTEIRHHGYYYPACKGKCEPILHHMLQGLRVDENPLLADSHRETKLDILYEDDYLLVINKPEGMLSVPGKGDVDSVYQRLSILYPEATGPIIVHRLDMATSGLLLAAKTKEAHQDLQAQFKNRTIQKRYIALLEGEVPQDEGEIRLPLCSDPLDRPRQIVSEEFGKPALTRYRVLERTSGKTLIAFYPQTGRTHQLRVHAAHPLGLHCPILGDELYGRKAERLYLHAEYLAFTHPITFERIEIRAKIPFSQH